MRTVRVVVGVMLLLVGVPVLFTGGGLWYAMQHRDGGGYTATLSKVTTDGYAVVVSDVDGLLRREVPFARSGRTTLRLSGYTGSGPAFIGLARATDVARYLADVPFAQVERVRLARGPLPVTTRPVDGRAEPPTVPHEQPFWLLSSGAAGRPVEWSPADLRGEQLALVVMDPQARAPLTVELTAQVEPRWLTSTALGLIVLGTVLVLLGAVAVAWPGRNRQVVYVVPPAQVPEVAARLGVHVPPGDVDWIPPREPVVSAPLPPGPPTDAPPGPPRPTAAPDPPASWSSLALPEAPARPPSGYEPEPPSGWPPQDMTGPTAVPVSVPPAT